MTAIATLITCLGILGLLLANRDPKVRTSLALWLAVIWVAIATSRSVSMWLQIAPERSVDQYLEGSPLDRNVFIALLGLGLIVLMVRARRIAPLLRSNMPLLVFFSYCAVSVLWSDFPDVAFKRWIKALGDLVMVLIVLTERDPPAAIKRLFARTAFVFVPLSLLFIRYFGDLGRRHSSWESVSYNGIAVDKNMLGMACLIFGLALFWRLLQEFASAASAQRRRSILSHGVVLAMLVLLLLISNSMTSLGAFILASGLMIAVSSPKIVRKGALIHLMVVAIATVILLTVFADIGGLLLQQIGRNPTLTGRTELWSDILALGENPLFGSGFESFWLGPRLQKLWELYWWRPNQAHNGYLDTYLNLGWIGICLLALVALTGYHNILWILRYDPGAAALRLAYFVAAVVYNVTESAFKPMHPVWLGFLLAVLVVPRASMKHSVRGPAGENAVDTNLQTNRGVAASCGTQVRFSSGPN